MDEMELLMQLHLNNDRQGPGGTAETHLALELCRLHANFNRQLRVIDIGCGTGAQTLTIAEELDGHITAVDLFPEFLNRLQERACLKGLTEKITPLQASMDNLPFKEESFDLIWSEGAVYNIGFKKGTAYWHKFLKPSGLIAVSEISWLTEERPKVIEQYWKKAYPEIDTIPAKIHVLEESGYMPIAHFVLPEHCWIENYYLPLLQAHTYFLKQNQYSTESLTLVKADEEEYTHYQQYKSYYSYGFYIAKKI